jgi:hypothetical protein
MFDRNPAFYYKKLTISVFNYKLTSLFVLIKTRTKLLQSFFTAKYESVNGEKY